MPYSCVITGVSRGLGRSLAGKLISLGHRVAGCARNSSSIAELRKEFPDKHSFLTVDITSDSQVRDWADKLAEQEFEPDFLINNAGIINNNAPLWEVPAEEMRKILSVNIEGTVNTIRHFVPLLAERRKAVIVNFSSTWGCSVSSDVAPYCATKWAIEGLSKALAEDLPSNVKSFPLNPGIIDTSMLQQTFGSGSSHYESPDEWAERAAPFMLGLLKETTGKSVAVP